jgi:hypothetical protein
MAQQSGAYVCEIHGPLPIACGRKCPHCGPPWLRHVRWDPKAAPAAEPLRPAPVLDTVPRTALDPAHMAIALAALNEASRLAHARALGCGDGPGNTPTLESALREAGLERMPESTPAVPPLSPVRRSRDSLTGRYLPEERAPSGPLNADERMSQDEVYAGVRKIWHQLPHGSRKGFARLLRLPVGTVRGIAKGRARLKARVLRMAVPGRSPIAEGGLPEATRRSCSRVLSQIERGELEAVKTAQVWPNGTPRYVFKRPPVGDAGQKT